MSEDKRLSLVQWLASRPFSWPPRPEEVPKIERAWYTAIACGLGQEEALRRARGDASLWDSYLADSRSLPVPEARRLDAAEAMVHCQFGISPSYYVRAVEAPGKSAKLADVVAAVVLRRGEWEPDWTWAP